MSDTVITDVATTKKAISDVDITDAALIRWRSCGSTLIRPSPTDH
jgi:hypothetical protein